MPHYNLHYCYDEVDLGPESLNTLLDKKQLTRVERHARVNIEFAVAIEFASDLVDIENWLAALHGNSLGHSNFRVLHWQPLLGEQRSAHSQPAP